MSSCVLDIWDIWGFSVFDLLAYMRWWGLKGPMARGVRAVEALWAGRDGGGGVLK